MLQELWACVVFQRYGIQRAVRSGSLLPERLGDAGHTSPQDDPRTHSAPKSAGVMNLLRCLTRTGASCRGEHDGATLSFESSQIPCLLAGGLSKGERGHPRVKGVKGATHGFLVPQSGWPFRALLLALPHLAVSSRVSVCTENSSACGMYRSVSCAPRFYRRMGAPWHRFVWSCRECPDPAGGRRLKRSAYIAIHCVPSEVVVRAGLTEPRPAATGGSGFTIETGSESKVGRSAEPSPLLEILEAREQGVEARLGLFEGGLLRVEGQQIARSRLPPEHLEPVAGLSGARG